MAITYPRALPCGVIASSFRISQGISTNRLNGGITQVRQFAEPRWTAEFTYAGMMRRKHQEIEAWIDSLRGGLFDFYAHDPLKPYPVMYPKGVVSYPSGFIGNASVTSVGTNSIGVSGSVSYSLKVGDHVGLVEGAKRGLFRIVEDFTGASGTLNVEPRIIAGQFTTGAFAQYNSPVCTMTIDISSLSASRTARTPSPISFAAIQKVY